MGLLFNSKQSLGGGQFTHLNLLLNVMNYIIA